MPRRFLLLALAALLAGGCESDKARPQQASPAGAPSLTAEGPPPETRLETIPATQPAFPNGPLDPDQAELATAAHVQMLQHVLARRAAPVVRSPDSVDPAPALVAEPSTAPVTPLPEVKWLDVEEYRFELGPPQDPRGAFPVPDHATTDTVPAAPVTTISSAPTPAPTPVAPVADQLEASLARQIRDYPRDLAAQIDYQLLQLIKGGQVPQLQTIASLPAEDRELISALLDALANLRTTVRGEDNAMLARKIRPLLEMADRLRTAGDLRVPAVILCRGIQGFGNYEPLQTDQLPAGRENVLALYCEVDNFSSRLNEQKMWETNLTTEAVLYTDTGRRVWSDKPRRVVDHSRNRRRDFSIATRIVLPGTLPVGRYFLKVTVADQQSNQVAEASTSLQIVAIR